MAHAAPLLRLNIDTAYIPTLCFPICGNHLASRFRLKLLAEQYQTREQHLEKLNEQVQLEAQLHQAKLSKAQVEAAMEKEILSK